MKVIQSLNQNALLVINDENEEVVALGKGIGFGIKKGDPVDLSKVSRLFTIESSKQERKLLEVLRDIDEEVYVMAEEVVDLSEKELGKQLNETFIFTIAKHIQFAIERNENEIGEYDPFQYQLKYLYPDEYRVSEVVIDYLNRVYKLDFKNQELSFFTLHYVNGLIDSEDFSDVVKLSNILNDIIELIMTKTNNGLDKQSINYSRFIVHLRYFLIRMMSKDSVLGSDVRLLELLNLSKEMYVDEVKLISDIKEMLKKNYQLSFGSEEEFYLLLHLVRILGEEERHGRFKGDTCRRTS